MEDRLFSIRISEESQTLRECCNLGASTANGSGGRKIAHPSRHSKRPIMIGSNGSEVLRKTQSRLYLESQ